MDFDQDLGKITGVSVIDASVTPPAGGTAGLLTIIGTGAIKLPVGNTAQQPANSAGLFRYNSSLSLVEFNNGGSWISLGGAADHGGLTGLADDDHPQYHNDTRGDLRYNIQNGFEDRTQSTISFVDGTRTFTITPVGTFYMWCGGTRYAKSSPETIVIDDTEGLWYIYYNTSGVLTKTQTFSDLIITTYSFVTAIYWDATNNVSVILGDERHGREMDSMTHLYNHNVTGSKWGGGLAPSNVTADGNGKSATHAQIGVTSGSFWDEDIKHSVSALTLPAAIPFLYRLGAAGDWRKIASSGYVVTTTGTGRAAWNEYTGATWQLTEITTSDYMAMHLVATNNTPNQMYWILGQAKYTTVGNARTGIDTEWNALETGGLATLIPEFIIVASFIIQSATGYSNAVKSRIVSTSSGAGYVDFRKASGGGAAGPAGADGIGTTTSVGALINSATSKPIPIAADQFIIMDSAAANLMKKISWTELLAAEQNEFVGSLPVVSPSLVLDFANGQVLDPRITFTRASTGSYTNKNGLFVLGAIDTPRLDFDPLSQQCKGVLVEEARTNLLSYTNYLIDNTAWTKTRCSLFHRATTAPDGTMTASKMVEDTSATTSHFIVQTGITITANQTWTFSGYFKAAERSIFYMLIRDNTATNGFNYEFNLGAKTVAQRALYGTGAYVSASITEVGNGWFRCVGSGTLDASSTSARFEIYLEAVAFTGTYTGDGISGLYVWGVQMEQGAYPTSYIPSTETFTSRASTGSYYTSAGLLASAAINTARYSYTPSYLSLSPTLLLEIASTNQLTYSEDFSNAAWSVTRTTISANTATAPDGTTTADSLIEDSTATNTHYVSTTGNGYAGTSVSLTWSCYVKANTRSVVLLQISNGTTSLANATFDLNTGFVTSPNSTGADYTNVTALMEPINNGWYRCSVSAVKGTANTTNKPTIHLTDGTTQTYNGNGTSGVYIWGAQLEVNPFPTSYIPTTTATVTRSADLSSSAAVTRAVDLVSMTGTNFTSWYNPTEGTFVTSFDFTPGTRTLNGVASFCVSDGTASNLIGQYVSSNSAPYQITAAVYKNAVAQAVSSYQTALSTYQTKAALAYKVNDIGSNADGVSAGFTDTTAGIPAVSQLNIGSYYVVGNRPVTGHIANLTYYTKRLTATEMAAITKP